ncbi:MAG: type III pantothenate kinase [Synergistaceae bacterium]|nr:type III pantothenate kinase [Synergistaceae bacterium]
MLLVIDAGNTTIIVGLFDGDELVGNWRLSSRVSTSDEFGVCLLTLFSTIRAPIAPPRIDGAILASVVPPLDLPIREAVKNYLGVDCMRVDSLLDLGMEIRYGAPLEVGADRLVNAVGGRHKYGAPLIIVDYGTAITLDVVSEDGAYLGGVIAPGLITGVQALFSRAAKMPQVGLELPPRVIGRNTNESTQSGMLHGNAGLTEHLIEKIRGELGIKAKAVATGGHAELMASLVKSIDHVDQRLTLDGLRLIYERNKPSKN